MDENNIAIENISLFLDLDQAVRKLAEHVMGYENSEPLMVVLSQDAMPVANEFAKRLGLNLTFTAVDVDKESTDTIGCADFDYCMVKESGRDIPQDFIYHQEQSLRTNLSSIYEETYKEIQLIYPSKFIVLVDELTNSGAAFLPSFTQRYESQPEVDRTSVPASMFEKLSKVNRHFIFLHACGMNPANGMPQHLDIIIEAGFAELDTR